MQSKLLKKILFLTIINIIICLALIYYLTLLDNQITNSPNVTLLLNIIKLAIIFSTSLCVLLLVGATIYLFIQKPNKIENISEKNNKIKKLEKKTKSSHII